MNSKKNSKFTKQAQISIRFPDAIKLPNLKK